MPQIIREVREKLNKEARVESAKIMAEQLARDIKEQAKKEARERIKREVEQIIREARERVSKQAEAESAKIMAEQLARDIKEQAKKEAREKAKQEAEQIIREAMPAAWEEGGKEPSVAIEEPEERMEPVTEQSSPTPADSFEIQNHHPVEVRNAQIADKIKVFVVDRDFLFYEGLRLYLSQTEDIAVIGKSEDFVEDTGLMIEELEPNVVLVDTNLPSTSGFDLTRQISGHLPAIPVIMLTPYTNDDQTLAALKAGAAGYLGKDITAEELASAIRRVSTGDHIINHLLARPRVAQLVLNQLQDTAKTTDDPATSLSPEATEILSYLARGYSRKQATHAMAMDDETIEDTLAAIVSKLIASEYYLSVSSGNTA